MQILQGLSLTVEKGETVALVGPSGCGKSTVIQLMQRFYDPDSGSVELEGEDIRKLNLGSLRDKYVFMKTNAKVYLANPVAFQNRNCWTRARPLWLFNC